jgi:hypothetical protein
MLSAGVGLALFVWPTLNVMREAARMGSGPSTTKLAGVVVLADCPALLTKACVPIASHFSARAAIGLAALLGVEVMALLPP